MEIRMATEKETIEILTHWREVLSEATAGYLESIQTNELTPLAPFFYHDFDYMVYVSEGSVQGWIGVGEIREVYNVEAKGFISELYVLPKFRNQGVGKKLCQKAIAKFTEEEYRFVQLNVFKENDSRNLYEGLGFTEVSSLLELELDS